MEVIKIDFTYSDKDAMFMLYIIRNIRYISDKDR